MNIVKYLYVQHWECISYHIKLDEVLIKYVNKPSNGNNEQTEDKNKCVLSKTHGGIFLWCNNDIVMVSLKFIICYVMLSVKANPITSILVWIGGIEYALHIM